MQESRRAKLCICQRQQKNTTGLQQAVPYKARVPCPVHNLKKSTSPVDLATCCQARAAESADKHLHRDPAKCPSQLGFLGLLGRHLQQLWLIRRQRVVHRHNARDASVLRILLRATSVAIQSTSRLPGSLGIGFLPVMHRREKEQERQLDHRSKPPAETLHSDWHQAVTTETASGGRKVWCSTPRPKSKCRQKSAQQNAACSVSGK